MILPIARVAIPRPNVEKTWDYLVPPELVVSCRVGVRVRIAVGRGEAIGIVTELAGEAQTGRRLQPILTVLDNEPLFHSPILELTAWAAEYYLASWGDLLKAALPAGMLTPFREMIRLTPVGRKRMAELAGITLRTEEEGAMLHLLDDLAGQGPREPGELQKDHRENLISLAAGQGYVEQHQRDGTPALERTVPGIVIADNPPEVPETFWKRSPKRRAAWELMRGHTEPVALGDMVKESGISRAVWEGLIAAGLAESRSIVVRRDPFARIDVSPAEPFPLTDRQSGIFDPIVSACDKKAYQTFLLHGVTGSGKTEIYLHLIRRVLAAGRTAMVLIPELSLTPQFARRYFAVFGDDLAVLHSGLTSGQRMDEWNRIRRGSANVVLGTRLSIFAPLADPGLIIVDEEHDASYKQDEYPCFSARDLAVVRASQAGAVCLLGSATPSLESLYNADRGKYRLLELKHRVNDRPLPHVHLVDLRAEEQKPTAGAVPESVRKALADTLKRGDQALVLVGRKGYAPFVLCRSCGNSFECPNCSISRSWHEDLGKLKCHFCGKQGEMPQFCPVCGSTSVEALGAGTSKVEEYLRGTFPSARIERMDRDIITRHEEYREVLDRLRRREIDLIVGTQMIAKGHDYPGVTTVVAMGIDAILRLPDFRNSERIFQLIVQMSGRAGRGENPGDVHIITYRAGHYAVDAAIAHDWQKFLGEEMAFRRSLSYPPFGAMAVLVFEDYDRRRGLVAASSAVERLHTLLAGKGIILGPALAPYARLKNKWRHQVIVKSSDRPALNRALRQFQRTHKGPTALKITIDPMSVM